MVKEIVEQWHEENFTMVDEVAQAALITELERELIPRAKVAAALEELRAEMQARMRRPPSFEPEIEVTVKSSARHWLQRLDATITKLGLALGKI